MSGFSFGTTLKKVEEEQPFEMTEQTRLRDIPENSQLWKEFRGVFQQIMENETKVRAFKEKMKKEMLDCAKKENKDVMTLLGEKAAELERKTKEIIRADLTSVEHMIDRGNAAVDEYKKASDLRDRVRSAPESVDSRKQVAAYVTGYMGRVKRTAEQLSRNWAVWWSQLGMSSEQEADELVLQYLKEQQRAVVLMASRVADVRKRLEEVRDQMDTKMRMNAARFGTVKWENKETRKKETLESQEREVEQKYNKFLGERKKEAEQRSEESDLFGNRKKQKPQTTGGLGFGSGSSFGSSFGSGFGNKTATTANKTTTGSTGWAGFSFGGQKK